MINLTKHTKTNVNPFVELLKDGDVLIKGMHDGLVYTNGKGRALHCVYNEVHFNREMICLVNDDYVDFGTIEIPRKDMLSKKGFLIFTRNPEHSSFNPTSEAISLFFSFDSEEELWDLVSEIDSSDSVIGAKNKINEIKEEAYGLYIVEEGLE